MCYTKIEAFKGKDGVLYESETEAIAAEIKRLLNDKAATATTVLDNASALVPLLQRALAIRPPEKPVSGKPDGVYTVPLAQMRSDLLGRLQAWGQTTEGKTKAVQFILSGGYKDLPDLNARATDIDVELMHSELNRLLVK